MTSNPFFEPSALPYELPPFAEIGTEHYLPAFERGMAEQLAEVAAISSSGEEPSFANTIAALERSGAVLIRVSNVFFNITGSDSSETTDAIEAEVSPKLAAHRDVIYLDTQLFARVEALYGRGAELGLDPIKFRAAATEDQSSLGSVTPEVRS